MTITPKAIALAQQRRLLAASDIAGMCGVCLKTIHNWVDEGKVPEIRTPGGHRRFRPAEVIAFLQRFAFDIPAWLTELAARVEQEKSSAPTAQAG